MTTKCAREECGKTVYPIEELKCLDKIWHKGCFKCTTCGMTLSMKTYKGYEKKPYCDAHYPKTVPSAVTDTPDMIRARQNTANQSSVKYHEQYEKMKGTKIDVADDPELKRLMDNTKNQSLTTYHGEQKKKEVQDQHRTDGQPNAPVYDFGDPVYNSASLDSLGSAHSSSGSSSMQRQQQQQRNNNGNGNGNANSYSSNNGFSYSSSTVQYPQQACQPQFAYIQPLGAVAANNSQQQQQYQQQQDGTSPYSQRIAQQARGTVVYSSEMGGRVAPGDKPVGSIADYDPMSAEAPKQPAAPAAAATASGGGGKAPAGNQSGFTVKALYDYSAADKDEVSFKEGDVIVNCQIVDDGWYTGTVQRTLLWGMLPANYVEKITQPTGMFRVK